MALENCDITESTFNAIIDTNLSSRSLAERTLTITAAEGHVVSASDFTLPDPANINGITNIQATNTAFPGEPDNTVEVVLTMDTSFNATAQNNTITLGITGSAKLHEQPLENTETVLIDASVIINENLTNCSISRSAIIGGFSGTNVRIEKANGHLLKSGVTNTISSYTVTASGGNRFLKAPTLELVSNNLENKNDASLALVITGETKQSNGNITAYTFDLNYSSNISTFAADRIEYNINAEAVAIPTSVTEIKKVNFGSKKVSQHGSFRKIVVYGNVGARFTLSVKETGQSNFFSESHTIQNTGKFFGLVKGVSSKIFNVKIPAKSTSTTYEVIITLGSGTTFNTTTMGSGSTTRTFVIEQSPNPSFVLSTAVPGGATYSQPANITKVGRVDKTADQLKYLKNLKLNFPFNYTFTNPNITYSVTKVPEFKLRKIIGRVDANDLDRIYLGSTYGLVTGMKVVEHSDDTSLPARVIQTIVTDQYVEVSVDIASPGSNKEFTFVKSDWQETACVPHLNGGTEWKVSNITATVNNSNVGNTLTIKGRVTVKKYGKSSIVPQLLLNNIIG